MSETLEWRIMCFDCQSERLVQVINLGPCSLDMVKSAISPSDNQEMCGSYELTSGNLAWLSDKFRLPELPGLGFDMFLERDS